MGIYSESEQEGRLVPLDIVLDYPVNWEFWRVLRDLIQNFYDSIGYKNFYREFEYHYEYDENNKISLTMSTKNHPFSYEWLTYFGGSTKTGKEGYVGKYGEGFKICALCLVRMKYQLIMESQDWYLEPCTYAKEIDGREVKMLGYRVLEREDDGITKLTVRDINGYEITSIREGLLHFFYPENPLFGKKIADTDTYAVYERSEMPVPRYGYPSDGIEGVLYFQYLARGELPFPLIILTKNQKCVEASNRDRNTFMLCQVTMIVYKAVVFMTPEDSYAVLKKMEKYWRDLPKFRRNTYVDVSTWYYVVCQLVRNVCRDKKLSVRFIEEYPSLIYLDRISYDTMKNRKIREASEWYRATGMRAQIVNPIFRLLGVPSLIELYRLDMEQNVLIKPEGLRQEQDRLLEMAYRQTVSVYLGEDEQAPEILISEDYKGSPSIFCKKCYGKDKKGYRHRKYEVETIIMDPKDYQKDHFYKTFLKYATGRFRAYGMDRSNTMTVLLSYLGGWMYENRECLETIRRQWEEYADED